VIASLGGVQSLCTGIVLDPRLVLTAEHCLAAAAHADVATDCANATLPPIDPRVQAWVVSGASPHDAGSAAPISVSGMRALGGATRMCGDDIAVLELASPLVQANALSITASTPVSTAHFLAVGYGTDGVVDGVQRQNPAGLILCVGGTCNDGRIATNELLASSGACAGDSGSPAIDESGRAFAMAVRSSNDCSETAYLQFAPHLRWLATNVTEVAGADSRTPPTWASDALYPSDAPDAGNPYGTAGIPMADTSGCGCALHRQRGSSASWLATLLLVAVSSRVRRATASRRG